MDVEVWSTRTLSCPPLPAHPKELHLADIDNNGSIPMVTPEATPTNMTPLAVTEHAHMHRMTVSNTEYYSVSVFMFIHT